MTNKSDLFKARSNTIKKTEEEQTEVLGLEAAPKEIKSNS